MRLKFEKWNPWGLSRKQMKKHNVDFPVQDEDQFVENRKSTNTDLTIFYSPFYSLTSYNGGDLNDWESYKIQFIRSRLNNIDLSGLGQFQIRGFEPPVRSDLCSTVFKACYT